MKKAIGLFAAALVLVFTSCNSGQQSGSEENANNETVTVTHNLGTIEVPVNPQRVVVLEFGALENLDAIGVKPVAIAKNALPDYLSKFKDDESIEDVGNITEVDIEKINELQPDLIIIGGRLAESYETLSKIAPTYNHANDTEDILGSLKNNLNNLGQIFNKEEEFKKAFDEIKTKAEEVHANASVSDEKALVVLHNKGRFSAYGSKSRFAIVHDVLGVKEAKPGLDTHTHGNVASNEFIQQVNPDILFVIDRSAAIGDQALNKEDVENKLIQQTNAYKNDKIVYLDSQAWYLSGTGIISVNMMIDEVASVFN